MNDSFSSYDQSPSGLANGSKGQQPKKSPSEPRPVPPWLKEVVDGVAVQGVLGIGRLVLLTLAVIVGTSLGNGVPMARSASVAFKEGFQTGLKECPCNKKGPTPVVQSVPRPTSAGQKLVINPVPEPITPGGKSVTPSPIKTALLETLDRDPVSKDPKAFEVKESVIRSKVTEPSKVFENK